MRITLRIRYLLCNEILTTKKLLHMKKLILLLIVSFTITIGAQAQTVVLKDGIYRNSKGSLYSGSYTAYSETGNKKSTFVIQDGKANGKVTYYYENGNVMETGVFVANEKSGEWLRWDEAGHKIAEAYYVSGKKNGNWIIWDGNGTKRYSMMYALGEKTGTWYMWDEIGKLVSEKNYTAI